MTFKNEIKICKQYKQLLKKYKNIFDIELNDMYFSEYTVNSFEYHRDNESYHFTTENLNEKFIAWNIDNLKVIDGYLYILYDFAGIDYEYAYGIVIAPINDETAAKFLAFKTI